MNCEACGAPVKSVPGQAYFLCEYCSTIKAPQMSDEGFQVIGETADERCPLCDQPLVTAQIESYDALVCQRCRGFLTPQKNFARIVNSRRASSPAGGGSSKPISKEARERRLRCPKCGGQMNCYPYMGPGAVLLDNCGECWVIWLDPGELETIENA